MFTAFILGDAKTQKVHLCISISKTDSDWDLLGFFYYHLTASIHVSSLQGLDFDTAKKVRFAL